MAKLLRSDVLKLAQLCSLELSDEETSEFMGELNQILDFVEQLKNVDTEGLSPTNQVTGLINVMREDVPIDYGYQPKELLSNVPVVKDDHIQVKRMVG